MFRSYSPFCTIETHKMNDTPANDSIFLKKVDFLFISEKKIFRSYSKSPDVTRVFNNCNS